MRNPKIVKALVVSIALVFFPITACLVIGWGIIGTASDMYDYIYDKIFLVR